MQYKDGLPEKLKDYRVIGVNNALHLDWDLIDIIWFGDSKWCFWHFDKLRSFPGIKACCREKFAGKFKWLKVMGRAKPQGIETREGYIAWNRSSGSSAINLAYHLGAKKIVLFGFDMRLVDGQKNWMPHPRERTKENPYIRFAEPFKKIMRDAKDLNIEIVNASPDSGLLEYNVPEIDWREEL